MCIHELQCNGTFCISIVLFTQIQGNLKLVHNQGGLGARRLILGLEAANEQLETTVSTVCGQVSLYTLHAVINTR